MEEFSPLLAELESLFSALSDKTRLEIVLLLMNKENGLTVQDISKSLNKSQSLISHHLACLRNCGVVKVEKRGKFSVYIIYDTHVKDIIKNAIEHSKEYSNSILSCEIIKEEKSNKLPS
ncbi:metalloregulator ArsR/SmtB family transcription factor [Acidianus sulfidivorans JP7]|uniref:Transcriptional regulator n=1 Tax=Acidianus sulfidivorans JP7 TaxID=619593 RepID=A0A2U9IL66_9CREN|nr:metalloregulator ArsR/SmtB family transcription factor [Acidianus sulfidivorans]AWR96735.1 metalloregulator ArsR/SmtB family transcription factor [Acidianus sulfidivorans JP7]